jgi:hypothetical protein
VSALVSGWSPHRRRLVGIAVAALVAVPLALTATGSDSVRAAGEPGRFVWVETLDRGDTFRVVAGAAAGQPATLLAPRSYGRPALSPDGRRVAYSGPVAESRGRYALFVVDVDGSNRRQLTSPRIGDFDPAWSYDGTTLAVSRDERGDFESSCCTIWTVRADGGGERRLAGATFGKQPAWSPDGRQIAFTAPSGIRAVDIATDAHRSVLQGALSWPTWSPDGGLIAAARRFGVDRGTVTVVPAGGGEGRDTAAGSGGGLPESLTWGEQGSIYHLSTFGIGEDGRTRAEAVRTDVGGGSFAVFDTGRPMYYLSWTPTARVMPPPPVRGIDRACDASVPEDGFTDVPPDDVHERAIDCAVHYDIASGRTAVTYAPADLVSREQLAGFLARTVRAAGGTLPEPTRDHFPDDGESVHADAIDRLAEAGLISGRADGRFDPRGQVSRAQLASFLTRVYDYRATQAGGQALPPGENWFWDDRGSVHAPAIDRAASAGIAGGVGDGRYVPDGGVRRDQLAGFVMRAVDLLVERGHAQAKAGTQP